MHCTVLRPCLTPEGLLKAARCMLTATALVAHILRSAQLFTTGGHRQGQLLQMLKMRVPDMNESCRPAGATNDQPHTYTDLNFGRLTNMEEPDPEVLWSAMSHPNRSVNQHSSSGNLAKHASLKVLRITSAITPAKWTVGSAVQRPILLSEMLDKWKCPAQTLFPC